MAGAGTAHPPGRDPSTRQEELQRLRAERDRLQEQVERLRWGEEHFRNLVEGSIQGIFIHRDFRIVFANQALADIFGFDAPEELIRLESSETLIAPRERERLRGYARARMEGRPAPVRYEYEGRRRDGTPIWLENIAGVVNWEGVPAFQGTVVDITGRHHAEAERERSQRRLRDFAEAASDWFWEMDAELRFSYVSEQFQRATGLSPENILGRRRWEIAQDRDEREKWARHRADLEQGRPFRGFEYAYRDIRGRLRHARLNGLPVLDGAGRFLGYRGTGADITEEKAAHQRAEEANRRIRESEERYRHLVEGSIQGVVVHRDFKPLFANQAHAEMFDFASPEEVVSQVDSILDIVDESERERVTGYNNTRMAGRPAPVQYEFKGRRRDGGAIWLDSIHTRVVWEGQPAVQATFFDVTERKHLQEQLRQSQKMEAVGQLAGGIAHDFNNMLQIIGGYSELALQNVADAPAKARRDLKEVREASGRASTLTRQLLAFSRRQVLQRKEVDLNETLSHLVKMLRRLIGENIELAVVPAPDLAPVQVDPGSIEQALINLCLNARDAMPGGGRLTVETANAELSERYCAWHSWARPGRYALVSVADTGTGMSPQVAERALEPFYTTKEPGHGTGLGLSMAYGIVRQHDGLIHLDSEPGQGTTVRLYLPARAGAAPAAEPAEAAEPPGGHETILLAEDNPGVRTFVVKVLEAAGYRVLAVGDGQETLQAFAGRGGEVDLVMLDLVMPGASGRQVFDRIMAERPEARVLFTSGYSPSLEDVAFFTETGIPLLPKPFSHTDLLHTVRDLLDQP